MANRVDLQYKLEEILGSRNVYFNPPESLSMNYPAIIYNRSNISRVSADNSAYKLTVAYTLTLIDKDPDSRYVTAIASLPLCRHTNSYKADNLNHDVFTIYF